MAGSWLKRLHSLMSAFVERKLKANHVIARKSLYHDCIRRDRSVTAGL
jgi:hypothetical protein